MARNWFPEERAKQAELIRRHKPWEKSTGPRTAEGKQAVKNNGYKHGWRSEDIREVYRLLRALRQNVRAIEESLEEQRAKKDGDA